MLPAKARSAVERHRMFAPGDLVVVGVSGGPDSVALLHWLLSYTTTAFTDGAGHAPIGGSSDASNDGSTDLSLRLHVAHLNHMLRGQDSAADALWVAALAERLGLPFTIEAVDTAALRSQLRLSVEDAARQARYAFFARVVRETGASCVAVAHTSDDQVETVVMHWLRGSGLAGLRGMLPVRTFAARPLGADRAGESAPTRVVRPFLDVSRAEVQDYLASRGLTYRTDTTNLEPAYLRNRVRLDLIPRLLEYNPRFPEATLRAAELASLDFDFIQRHVEEAWSRLATASADGVAFPLREWLELHPGLQRYLLRRAVESLLGDLTRLEAVHVTEAQNIVSTGKTGAIVTLPGGLRVVKGYDDFHVGFAEPIREPALDLIIDGQPLAIPGDTPIAGGNWRVTARIVSAPCALAEAAPAAGKWHADLDYAKTGRDLRVRRRWPGDRFRPLGMRDFKRLQDFLVDEKVPRFLRDEVPIVASDHQIVWVVGHRLDDRVKLTPDTREVLCLTFEKSS